MNIIKGIIDEIETDGNFSLVKIDTSIKKFYALLFESPDKSKHLLRGNKVNLLFKETEVEIVKDCSSTCNSFLNNFEATFVNANIGKVLTSLNFIIDSITINAIIPRKSFELLNLKINDKATLIIRTNEIALEFGE
ncbi:MAG: hypothetical protein K6348_06920 [Deferribacterales bacterium]